MSAGRTYIVEYGLTYKDAARIERTIAGVEVLVPQRTAKEDVAFGRRRILGTVNGTVPWYPETANKKIISGRFINHIEMERKANVCVIGTNAAELLFKFQNPMKKIIKIRQDYYKIIGIIETTNRNSADDAASGAPLEIFIPLTASRERFGEVIQSAQSGESKTEKVELHKIIVKVKNLNAVRSTAETISQMLKRFRKQNDYEVTVPLKLLEQAERTKQIFNIVLGSIAAISLLVGGIGIMNIMLATVTERTREIGIRRALGARKIDIVVQFLSETILLAGCGGVIGVFLGVAIPFMIQHFSGMTTIIKWWSPVGAFGISLVIGIVFGLYPAWRAAQMNPISALRTNKNYGN